jgi:LuxR family maltose regulon positive regulatory protein
VRLARGDRDGARAVLAEARAILDRNPPDAGILPGRLEREERRLRTSQRQEGTSSKEFTERELDVLRLLPGEFSTGEMGSILYVATSTVRTHVKSIYRKLGVSSRKKAVERARAGSGLRVSRGGLLSATSGLALKNPRSFGHSRGW